MEDRPQKPDRFPDEEWPTMDLTSWQTQRRVPARATLEALLEMSRNLSSSHSLEDLLPKILDSLFEIFSQADRGFVVLAGPEPGVLVPKAMKLRCGVAQETIRVSRTVVRRAMDGKEALLLANVPGDTQSDSGPSTAEPRSMMCAPLLGTDGVAIGALQIDTFDQKAPFTQDDLNVFVAAAGQAAVDFRDAGL